MKEEVYDIICGDNFDWIGYDSFCQQGGLRYLAKKAYDNRDSYRTEWSSIRNGEAYHTSIANFRNWSENVSSEI